MRRHVSLAGLGVLLVISSVGWGWGCSPLTSLLDWGGPRRTPHDEVVGPKGEAASPVSTPQRTRSAPESIRVVGLLFEVVRFDLPIDTVRHSRKIWNHVDELRVDPKLTARLARNGLRLGAVSQDAWPAIRAILDAGGATAREDRLFSQPGLPLAIEVGNISGNESIFSYGSSNRLVGKTFTVGDKVIHIGYTFHPDIGGRVDLQVGFEVRHDRGDMTWEKTEGIIQQVPAYDRHVFSELRAVIALHPKDSLMLGPGEQTRNEYLIGSRFFTGQRAGKKYETLYCVTPLPYQRPAARREGK